MALLKSLTGLLLPIVFVSACARVSLPPRNAAVAPDIAWIDRQFRTCGGKECPVPTRKTLALVDVVTTRQEASPDLTEIPPAATPAATPAEPPTRIVRFAFARSIPTAEGRQALDRLVKIATHYTRIELQGRTDDLGSKAWNDRLARRRAEYVRSWLIDRGIEAEITVRAAGRCCYLDPASTETARQNNRRVEIRLAGRRDAIPNHMRAH